MQLSKAATRVELGDDRRAKFCHDPWIDGRTVQSLASILISFVRRSDKNGGRCTEQPGHIRESLSMQALREYLVLLDVWLHALH